MKYSERVLVNDGGQKLVQRWQDRILWKNDRKTGKYLGHKETVFQNVYDSFDPKIMNRTTATISSRNVQT